MALNLWFVTKVFEIKCYNLPRPACHVTPTYVLISNPPSLNFEWSASASTGASLGNLTLPGLACHVTLTNVLIFNPLCLNLEWSASASWGL